MTIQQITLIRGAVRGRSYPDHVDAVSGGGASLDAAVHVGLDGHVNGVGVVGDKEAVLGDAPREAVAALVVAGRGGRRGDSRRLGHRGRRGASGGAGGDAGGRGWGCRCSGVARSRRRGWVRGLCCCAGFRGYDLAGLESRRRELRADGR